MKKIGAWFGVILVVYLTLGITYRLCFISVESAPYYVYIVGDDYYNSCPVYEFPSYLDPQSKYAPFHEIGETIYLYHLAFIETYFRRNKHHDQSVMDRINDVIHKDKLKNGDVISSFDPNFSHYDTQIMPTN